jgi:tetratricopeptide (TPR) repeat protein
MTRPQQNVAIAVIGLVTMLLAPLVLPVEIVWTLVGVAWGVSLVAFVARGPYGKARALLRDKQYEAAFEALREFEALVTAQAWRRSLAFLYAGFQTANPLALARGYQGVARLEQGRLSEAEALLVSALQLDPDYCLPWANRAIVAALLGDETKARAHADTARALGFTDARFDGVLADALTKGRPSASPSGS